MHKATLLCIATAVAMAGASTTADAARTLTKKQEAEVARIKEANRNFQAPRTHQDAQRTQTSTAKGTSIQIPLELYNQMAVRTDAHGNQVIVEIDGTETAAPAAEVLPNE